MKQYTHAWIAFKAVERLEKCTLPEADRKYADQLINWFKGRKDGVINGAWYPDEIIKDNSASHVLKFTPAAGAMDFRKLPSSSLFRAACATSALMGKAFTVAKGDNLPQRCEALSHSVIDNMKVQHKEAKGSPIAPTDNHVALILFMLSHYVADAHMPLHCDSRAFSEGTDVHAQIEKVWEDEVKKHFEIDYKNERFYYDPQSYPLCTGNAAYAGSFLKLVDDKVAQPTFTAEWGNGNGNVEDYMTAVCQYSYLLSYQFIPQHYDENSPEMSNWQSLAGQEITFPDMTAAVLSDAVDSVARVWFRVWRRYVQWQENLTKHSQP